MANFDPSQNRNPWADCNKIPQNWLRPRENTLNQIWYKSIHGGFWAYGWNITFLWLFYYFIYTFFSETRAQVRPVDGFLRAIGQKTWNHARMCLLGVMKLKFNAKPIFIPHNRQFLAQNGTVFFDRKCLTTHSIQRLSASKRKYRKTQQYNAKWQVAREA